MMVHAMAFRMWQDAALHRVGVNAKNVAQGTMQLMLTPEQQIFSARSVQRKTERNKQMSEHHELSPSKYPAWNECPFFENGHRDSADASEGTRLHEELRGMLEGGYESAEPAVRWAVDMVQSLGGVAPNVRCEERLLAIGGQLKGIFGTADVIWKTENPTMIHIADFKSFSDGTTDYMPQLRGYAALMYATCGRSFDVKLHVLHGGSRTVTEEETSLGDCYDLTVALVQLRRLVLTGIGNACIRTRLNPWCKFCAKIKECSATNNALQVVADNAPDKFGRMSLCQKLVVLDAVDKLSKSLREEAKRLANDNGGVLEHRDAEGNVLIRYEMKPWAGTPKVRDLCEVAAAVKEPVYLKVNEKKQTATELKWNGLEHSELLGLCSLSKSALADALVGKNPDASKADVKRYVDGFFEKTEGAPHFVRTI